MDSVCTETVVPEVTAWAWLAEIADQRSQEFYIDVVIAIEFISFCSLPDGMPFLVRLTMIEVTQFTVGKWLQREERRDDEWMALAQPLSAIVVATDRW